MYKKYLTFMLVVCQFVRDVSAKPVGSVVSSAAETPGSELFSSRLPLPVTHKLYADLADQVCSDIFYYNDTLMSDCCKNFLNLEPSWSILPPEVKVKCQLKQSVRFETKPLDNWQLVVLIAEEDGGDFSYINYSLLSANTVLEMINTSPGQNYTIWNTVLDDRLAPTGWRKVARLSPLDEADMAPKTYAIQKDFSNFNSTRSGTFTWQRYSDKDLCFDLMNKCTKTSRYEEKIWSDTIPHIVISGLQPNDECQIIVTGLHGSTSLPYSTPSCTESHGCLPGTSVKPEIPQNMSLEATEDPYSSLWDVEVRWDKPSLTPDSYNVTIRTDTDRTIVLPGNSTRVVFYGVEGQGLYNVSVYAIKGDYLAHNSRRAIFPVHEHPAWGSIWAGGVSAAGLALLAVGLCRRRRNRDPPSFVFIPPEIDDKRGGGKAKEDVKDEDLWEVSSDRVLLHEELGEGAFGVVRRATLVPTHAQVAVKMLKDFPTLEEIRSFHSEMELMKSVGAHPHVVSLVGCCTGRRPMIIAEYCSRGDLLSFLRYSWDVMMAKRNERYYNNNTYPSDYKNFLFKSKLQTEDPGLVINKMYDLQGLRDCELTLLDLLSFCRQIAKGMEFLAANRVVHRDLAARNVLVTTDKTLKIADFGLSRDVYEDNQYRQKGNGKMPIKWMALESLTRKIYTSQSDVWSFGVVMWEVVTVGGSPYAEVPAARLSRLLRAGYRMPRPNNCSKQLYELMLSCWSEHPRHRPSFTELHAKLDELLNSASADLYLTLELDAEDAPPTKGYKYLKLIMKGKRGFTRGESYERPLKPSYFNRYTSLPITAAKAQPI